MNCAQLSVGKAPPWDVNVVIEIPAHEASVKYEIDKASGALLVDRFIQTPMYYPANYGFVPNTLSNDGDPIDALVLTRFPVVPASVIRARPIGVLNMEDEAGQDEKIVMVPASKIDAFYDSVKSIEDLPESFRAQVVHFFQRYKDLEPGKWVKMREWGSAQDAADLIEKAVQRAQK